MVEELRFVARNIRGVEGGKYGFGAGMVDSLADYLEAKDLAPASLESKNPENNGLNNKDVPTESSNPIWAKDSSGRVLYSHPLFSFFPEIRRVKVGEKEIELTPKENRLLKVLVRNANKLLTAADLMSMVWDEHHETSTHYDRLKTRIHELRRKVEPDYHRPQIIVRVTEEENKKRGYMLEDKSRLGQEPDDQKEEIITYPGFMYFPERERMVANGLDIFFVPEENEVLKLMFKNLNILVGFPAFGDKKRAAIQQEIFRLRRKIKSAGISILTKRGKGYMLVIDSNPSVNKK